MAQISLPDTAVIDLSVIQTIVNAINRLDDMVSQISSSYSVATSDINPETASEFASVFNLTTHEIQFGREIVNSTGGTITFNRPFATGTKPIFVATVREDNDTLEISNYTYQLTNENAEVVVNGATTNVYLHWVAIGTRQA